MTNPPSAPDAPLADQPISRQRRLKLFCHRPLDPGRPTRELIAGFMERIDCPELELARIAPCPDGDCAWPTILTLSLPDHALGRLSHSRDYAELVAARLGVHIPALAAPAYALVDERGVGHARDLARLTLAGYRWPPTIRPAERERAILALLEPGRSRSIDQAVHVNTLLARRGVRDTDLLCETYGADPPASQPPRPGCDLLEPRWRACGQVEIVRPDG